MANPIQFNQPANHEPTNTNTNPITVIIISNSSDTYNILLIRTVGPLGKLRTAHKQHSDNTAFVHSNYPGHQSKSANQSINHPDPNSKHLIDQTLTTTATTPTTTTNSHGI